MSDSEIASIGRRLAKALQKFARDREPVDRQAVAVAQTELCSAVEREKMAEVNDRGHDAAVAA